MRELNQFELAAVAGAGNQPASHPFPPGPADKNFGPQ
jgi:hypothetical protein